MKIFSRDTRESLAIQAGTSLYANQEFVPAWCRTDVQKHQYLLSF